MTFFFRGSMLGLQHKRQSASKQGRGTRQSGVFSTTSEDDGAFESQVALGQSYLSRDAARSKPGRRDPLPPEQSCGATAEESGGMLCSRRPNVQILEFADRECERDS